MFNRVHQGVSTSIPPTVAGTPTIVSTGSMQELGEQPVRDAGERKILGPDLAGEFVSNTGERI